MTFNGGIIHATKDYAIDRSQLRYDYDEGNQCADCGELIQNTSTRCKPCAQQMRRKIDAQVKRLLALRDVRRAERKAT